MKLREKYLRNLNAVRNSSMLLHGLQNVVDKIENEANRLDRLRIASVLFHDLKVSDYGLVKFLFSQEIEFLNRAKHKTHQLYNLNLIGLLLSRYNNPEDIWLFFKAHQRERSFDIEFTLTSGVENVFNFLKTSSNGLKASLLRKIGSTYEKRRYDQEAITDWLEEQNDFMGEFCSEQQAEIHFACLMEEVDTVSDLLPGWVETQKTWNSENLVRYISYARMIRNSNFEIHSLELYLANSGTASVKHLVELSELYINKKHFEKATLTLNTILKLASDRKSISTAITGLCNVILNASNLKSNFAINAHELIQEHRRKINNASLSVKRSIDRATKLMATTEDSMS